jgi:hypothetical protein
LAEITASSALSATNQKSSFAIFPTLENVWATSLLANSMQAFSFDKRVQRLVLRAHLGFSFDPLRLALDRNLSVSSLNSEHSLWSSWFLSQLLANLS